MTEKTFAEKLKAARHATGLTQAELAERAQIPRRTIEGWEAGRMTPPDYVQRLVLAEVKRCNPGTTGRRHREHKGTRHANSPRYDGFGMSLSGPEWSKLSGIPRNSLWRYLKKGMTIEEIYKARGLHEPTFC